jgi:hypothetical protein
MRACHCLHPPMGPDLIRPSSWRALKERGERGLIDARASLRAGAAVAHSNTSGNRNVLSGRAQNLQVCRIRCNHRRITAIEGVVRRQRSSSGVAFESYFLTHSLGIWIPPSGTKVTKDAETICSHRARR